MPTYKIIQPFPLANVTFIKDNIKEAVIHANKHYKGYLKLVCVEHEENAPNLVRMGKLSKEMKDAKR